ncbi:hypothetical protein BC830DRAFT_1170379 [Chytriomyces sp. MP71]|nr:hypothetical protein BC830DRAFT_1170379 [Chytriomyces sp. MP71]
MQRHMTLGAGAEDGVRVKRSSSGRSDRSLGAVVTSQGMRRSASGSGGRGGSGSQLHLVAATANGGSGFVSHSYTHGQALVQGGPLIFQGHNALGNVGNGGDLLLVQHLGFAQSNSPENSAKPQPTARDSFSLSRRSLSHNYSPERSLSPSSPYQEFLPHQPLASNQPPIIIPSPPPPNAAALRAIPMNRQLSMPAPRSSHMSLTSDTASTLSSFSYTDSVASAPTTHLSSPGPKNLFRTRSYSEAPQPGRPSMSAISSAGFMEHRDPAWTLRHVLAQPNVMYGVVARERTSRGWLKMLKSWNSFLVVLRNGTLSTYHLGKNTVSRYKFSRPGECINGPFFSPGSELWDFVPGVPPLLASGTLFQTPSSVLRLTDESEVHVHEQGVYVLKVTGRKINLLVPSTPATAVITSKMPPVPGSGESANSYIHSDISIASPASGTSFSVADNASGLSEEKTWMLQFETAESMMEWMTRIRQSISLVKRDAASAA